MSLNFINILLIALSTTALSKGAWSQKCEYFSSILKCDQIQDLSLIDVSNATLESIATVSIRYEFI